MPSYDAIVLGLGAMGAAALDQLARRGLRVLGLEQFEIAHDRGSSHGETRIIRRSYFEHPDYVPLVDRSFELWRELEKGANIELFRRTGLLLVGGGEGMVIPGVLTAVELHRFDLQYLSPQAARDRFAGIRIHDDHQVLFEPGAGFLRVEDCVRALVDRARQNGAEVRTGDPALGWEATDTRVTVRTQTETYTAAHLILCAGPWSYKVIADLRLPLTVRRKPFFWFDAPDPRYSLERGFPIFGFDVAGGFYYGFPAIDGKLKVANHSGGEVVTDPSTVDRSLRASDAADVCRFLDAHLPGVVQRVTRSSVCLYTLTPDEHFILDRHPAYANVCLAAGFSGHGFKFAPVVGSVLADLVTKGATDEPISLLRLSRFDGLTER